MHSVSQPLVLPLFPPLPEIKVFPMVKQVISFPLESLLLASSYRKRCHEATVSSAASSKISSSGHCHFSKRRYDATWKLFFGFD
ncbi:hypothetical protein KIW84_025022 [Lathyrus oleraceus]|uniref:Uncharacterized protein n=1 Tax=Pisum sativum TaxID=3888 RepID=A0A9D5BA33_PEA|nr:hypothetical protein KIW84_025022 [Pisum sativum]